MPIWTPFKGLAAPRAAAGDASAGAVGQADAGAVAGLPLQVVVDVGPHGVTVDLTGATLAGVESGVDADALAGWGISIEGRRNVTIRGGAIRGFKIGIRAKDCVGLRIEDVDVSDNFRQRLGSTPAREDVRDWLSSDLDRRLTEPMLDEVMADARALASSACAGQRPRCP